MNFCNHKTSHTNFLKTSAFIKQNLWSCLTSFPVGENIVLLILPSVLFIWAKLSANIDLFLAPPAEELQTTGNHQLDKCRTSKFYQDCLICLCLMGKALMGILYLVMFCCLISDYSSVIICKDRTKFIYPVDLHCHSAELCLSLLLSLFGARRNV